jgi:hypothetical protein
LVALVRLAGWFYGVTGGGVTHGDAAGTRALIEVPPAHRTLPAAAVEAAMTRAIASGVLDAQAVLIDARRQAGGQVAPVIPLGALARYDRPALPWTPMTSC